MKQRNISVSLENLYNSKLPEVSTPKNMISLILLLMNMGKAKLMKKLVITSNCLMRISISMTFQKEEDPRERYLFGVSIKKTCCLKDDKNKESIGIYI